MRNSQYTEELLRLLRARISVKEVGKSKSVADHLLSTQHDPMGASPNAQTVAIRQIVEQAVEQRLVETARVDRALIRLMIGQDARTKSPTINRETIKYLMGQHIQIGRGLTESDRLTSRSVEQLEREEIVFLVSDAIDSYLQADPTPQRICDDLKLELAIRPASGRPGMAIMRVVEDFKVSPNEVIFIGVTPDEQLADGACRTFPLLTEVFIPAQGGSAEIHVQSVTGDDVREDLNLVRLSGPEAVIELAAESSDDSFLGMVHRAICGESTRRVRIVCDQEILIAEQYAYWSAPRRTLLSELRVDLSAFPRVAHYTFQLSPRIGRRWPINQDKAALTWNIRGPVWIEAGQSILVSWRRASA